MLLAVCRLSTLGTVRKTESVQLAHQQHSPRPVTWLIVSCLEEGYQMSQSYPRQGEPIENFASAGPPLPPACVDPKYFSHLF